MAYQGPPYRRVRNGIELKISAEGKRWYQRVGDLADVEIDITVNDARQYPSVSDHRLSQEVLRSCRVSRYPAHPPAFKVMRWRMEG